MNTFINFVKKSLVEKRVRDKISALKKLQVLGSVRTLLLLVLDLFARPWLAKLSCPLVRSVKD